MERRQSWPQFTALPSGPKEAREPTAKRRRHSIPLSPLGHREGLGVFLQFLFEVVRRCLFPWWLLWDGRARVQVRSARGPRAHPADFGCPEYAVPGEFQVLSIGLGRVFETFTVCVSVRSPPAAFKDSETTCR